MCEPVARVFGFGPGAVKTSVYNVFRFHLGSLAFGAFIIAAPWLSVVRCGPLRLVRSVGRRRFTKVIQLIRREGMERGRADCAELPVRQ